MRPCFAQATSLFSEVCFFRRVAEFKPHLDAWFAVMRFRFFPRRYPVNRRRLVVRRLFPRPLRWLLLVLLLAIVVLTAFASRWGNAMMDRFGRQEQSQAELARLQQEMLVLQHQLQAESPGADGPLSPTSSAIAVDGSPPAATADAVPSARPESGEALSGKELEAVNALAVINEVTLDALQEQVKELQRENQHLKNELSFYENLLPADDKSGLSIRSFNAQRRVDEVLSWQILLMQLKRGASAFKGELEWQISGTLDGKAWRLPAKERRQSIELGTYQRLEGQLRIPAQLQLNAITVVVWEGKQERARQSIAFEAAPEPDAQDAP